MNRLPIISYPARSLSFPVSVADLILVQTRVRETITELVRRIRPDVVGLSVMTFQRKTALKIIALVRQLAPCAKIVVGGYDATLAVEAYTSPENGADFDRAERSSNGRNLPRHHRFQA
jgi:hypothetical protein